MKKLFVYHVLCKSLVSFGGGVVCWLPQLATSLPLPPPPFSISISPTGLVIPGRFLGTIDCRRDIANGREDTHLVSAKQMNKALHWTTVAYAPAGDIVIAGGLSKIGASLQAKERGCVNMCVSVASQNRLYVSTYGFEYRRHHSCLSHSENFSLGVYTK